MTELALPAGSLQAALQAFKEGADAVYLGLQQFSARKGAANFTFEDLSRLKQVAKTTGRKIYVTVNTLVTDAELVELDLLLRQISFLELDGAIVQDLGVARMIRTRFPHTIPLHGSTQLAAHTVSGVNAMQLMGFSRVVLSRELTLSEIEAIRKACPDIELKVFIHGALCYGFSGLCMASHIMTGRSANRGECAQICRSWFSLAPGQIPPDTRKPAAERGYFFSMTDLDIGAAVQELKRIGIDSLKVEGRMKNPAYVAAATRYYRMLLDGEPTPGKLQEAQDELHTVFSRADSEGWLAGYGRVHQEKRATPPLGTVEYPGHLGVPVGRILAMRSLSEGTVASVRLDHPVAVHDGLLLLQATDTALKDPVRFSLSHLWNIGRKRVYQAEAGEQVLIALPTDTQAMPGDTLYRISLHNQQISEIHDDGLPLYRRAIAMAVLLEDKAITLSADLTEEGLPGKLVSKRFEIALQKARTPQDIKLNLSNSLSMSDESYLTLGDFQLENATSYGLEEIFIPLSQVKEVRRGWYRELDATMETWFKTAAYKTNRADRVAACEQLPARKLISPPQSRGLLWIDPTRILARLKGGSSLEACLSVVGGLWYLPLTPVLFNESSYLAALDNLILILSSRVDRGSLRIGLNNIGQILWARNNPDIPCFADIYLYMPNAEASALLVEQVPNLRGSYGWLERRQSPSTGWSCSASDPGSDFPLPLFISRSCFRYDSLGLSCEGCSRNGSWKVEQNGGTYAVEVHDCLTVVNAV